MDRPPRRHFAVRARFACWMALVAAETLFSPPCRAETPLPHDATEAGVLDPDRRLGRAALRDGNWAAARAAFTRAVGRNPQDADSLIALATIEHHAGRREAAAHWLVRAEQAAPADPIVLAARTNVAGSSSPQAESRIKRALHLHPDSPPLHFALGNLYARQQRWPEAALAFREASSGDPATPDYLYNLAVALDHAGRLPEAARHYRAALAAAGERSAAFGSAAVQRRLSELEPTGVRP